LVSGAIQFIKTQTGKITIGIVGTPGIINPLYSSANSVDESLVKLFYRSLITFNENSLPIGDLAESWELSDGGKTYIITLVNDAFWEDGTPITAADVIFTYNLIQSPEYNGPEKARFSNVGLTQINQNTLKLSLTESFSPFLESLNIGILPRHIWENIALNEIPSSLYAIQPVSATNLSVKKISVENNHISKINIENTKTSRQYDVVFLESEKEIAAKLKNGSIDIGFFTNKDISSELAEWPNIESSAHQVCGTGITWFSNSSRDANHPVHSMSLNESIASIFTQQENLPSLRYALSSGHWAYTKHNINTEKTEEDMRVAFDIIPAESPLKVSVMPDVSDLVSIASIRKTLESYGFKATFTMISPGNVEQMLYEREYDVLLAHQDFGHDPDQYTFWHSTQTDLSQGGLNVSGYKNRRMDKALEDGRLETDLDKRKIAYNTMQELLSEDIPALFFAHPNVYVAVRQNSNVKSIDRCLWHPNDWLSYIVEK